MTWALLLIAVGVAGHLLWRRSAQAQAFARDGAWLAAALLDQLRFPLRPALARLEFRILRRIEGAARAGVWSERQLPTTILVRLHPQDFELIEPLAGPISHELEDELARLGRSAGKRLLARPAIEFVADPAVWRGWPRLKTAFIADTERDETEPTPTLQLPRPSLVPTAGGPTLLLAHDSQRVGRSRLFSDLNVADPSVSRTHCRIFAEGDSWWLEDNGATNGTYLNGAAVTTARRLHDGDRVALGKLEFRFVLRPAGRWS